MSILKTSHLLDSIVPISTLNHGGASRTINAVKNDQPAIIMRNNKPAAVIITPEDYTRLLEIAEDYELYMLAKDRVEHDNGKLYTMDEAFGEDYRTVDDVYEPEFE